MITWLQTTFGKHHKVLLGLLLGITVVSFVFVGSWSTGLRDGRPSSGTYLGVDLSNKRKSRQYYDYVYLNAREGTDFTRLLYHTVLMLKIADSAQIPNPNKEQFQKILNDAFGTGDDLAKNISKYREHAKSIFSRIDEASVNDEATNDRIEQLFNNIWRVQQVQQLLSGPGYALPVEAALAWKNDNTKWTVETATFSGALFNPAITPADADLQKFFDAAKDNYRLPAKVAVNYVIFPAEKTGKTATTPAEIEQLGTDTAGRSSALLDEELPADESIKFEQNAARIAKFLEKHKLTAVAVPEFDKNTVPTNLPVPAGILQSALELTENAPRTDARVFGTDAVVLFLRKLTPARIPELAEVKDKVVSDFRIQEKTRLFNERSAELSAKLRDAVAAGKNFETEAKALELLVKKHPPFQAVNTPTELAAAGGSLNDALSRTPVGSVTPQIRVAGDTVYLLVVKKEEPTVDSKSPEVQSLTAGLGMEASFLNIYGDPRSGQPGLLRDLGGF